VRVPYAGDLSGIQWACLLALLVYLPIAFRAWLQLRHASTTLAVVNS
jgi:hypothetical protein